MYKTQVRQVGGSLMVTLPSTYLNQLHLTKGSSVEIMIDKNCLKIKRVTKPKYSLDELLSLCDYSDRTIDHELDWFQSAPVGGELL